MQKKDVIIKVDNVYKEYWLGSLDSHSFFDEWRDKRRNKGSSVINTRKQIKALNGVSFEVERGETVGLIGANGAGKSTLLKILSRITIPTEGKVYLDGTMSSMLEVGTGFHQELSGRENIYINGTILGMTKKEIDSKLEDIIEFSECREFIDTPVKRYSSGMYVKLAFAVAAYLDSDIMILDEVLAVGDMKFQHKCLDKIAELSQTEGRTVLCVSHNMTTISRLCKRCIVMDKGKVIFDGDTQEAIRVYFGEEQDSVVYADYSNRRRFPWLQRSDIRLQSVRYVGKEEAVFWDDEKVRIHFSWLYHMTVAKLCLRVELFDEEKKGVGASFLYDIESGETGNRGEVMVDMDISSVKEGKYSTIYTLFVRSQSGDSVDLDCINGLNFEKRIIAAREIVWKSKSWGCIELPRLELVEDRGRNERE